MHSSFSTACGPLAGPPRPPPSPPNTRAYTLQMYLLILNTIRFVPSSHVLLSLLIPPPCCAPLELRRECDTVQSPPPHTHTHTHPTLCAPQSWVKELHNLGPENIVIVLVGNKCDLESERVRWHSSQVKSSQVKSTLCTSRAFCTAQVLL